MRLGLQSYFVVSKATVSFLDGCSTRYVYQTETAKITMKVSYLITYNFYFAFLSRSGGDEQPRVTTQPRVQARTNVCRRRRGYLARRGSFKSECFYSSLFEMLKRVYRYLADAAVTRLLHRRDEHSHD